MWLVMSKTFRPYDHERMLLMPVALQEWLPAHRLAHFVSDLVDQLDFSDILERYQATTLPTSGPSPAFARIT